jgi:hypothetical protein
MAIARSIAYKVWISDAVSGNYVKQEGFNPNYIELDGQQVSRVHLVATVVGKFLSEDGNYGAITLDDGTDTIRAKAFGPDVKKIDSAEIGKLVRFVGKIKEYNDERYLAPDFTRELQDPNWITVQRAELGEPKTREAPKPTITPAPETPAQSTISSESPTQSEGDAVTSANKVSDTKPTETPKQNNEEHMPNLLELITKLDAGEGAEMTAVIAECKLSEPEAKLIIIDLLKQGEIYEPRKGKLKVL